MSKAFGKRGTYSCGEVRLNAPLNHRLLAEKVRQSFGDVPAPSRISVVPGDQDFESYLVEKAFHQKRWSDLTPELAQSRPQAIAFFSPEAFRYFLPGYLLLALEDISSLDVSLISLLSALAGPTYHEERLGMLSETQLATVLAVLDALTPEEAHPMYWNFEQAKQGVIEHLTRP